MKLALLDRDGVINVDREKGVTSKEEFCLLPKTASAIKMFNRANIPVAVVTNQACVGRGELSKEGLEEIHAYLGDLLRKEGAFIDRIFACTSADPDNFFRKPNPGLLLDAVSVFRVDPPEAVIIGDDLRDLEAGVNARCQRVLVRTGKGEKNLEKGLPETVLPVQVYPTLFEAASALLRERS